MERRFFKDLTSKDVGKKYEMVGKIEVVKQTSGPTLMRMNDGTANFTFKAFIKPGVRAYPEADINDYVRIEAIINERNDEIEGEIKSLIKLDNQEKLDFASRLDDLNERKIMPTLKDFSIKSDMLESQKQRFIKVATMIRKAVIENRPILLRHNADCDGYSSALTIERAITRFMFETTGDAQLQFQNYKRAPSKAPFYEYEDAVKDVAYWLRDKNRNNAKPPLVIITDNGSTEEDILSIKQMKVYDAQVVVVDHHYPGQVVDEKVEVDKYIDAHINPYLTGYDSNISAGMLGYELARFIYEDNTNQSFIPAMAGVLDHCECPEFDQYLEKAKKDGFEEEYLRTLGEIVDMQSHYARFNESREFFDELFGSNMKLQKSLIEMLGPELKLRYSAVEKVAKAYTTKTDMGKFYLMEFDGEKGTFRGDYPAIGKSTNHIHKTFENELDKPVVTVTHGTTFMTIRVSDGVTNFSVPEFVQIVFAKAPHANANGGGHEHAGSVRFVEFAREEIMKLFKEYLESVNKQN